MKSMSAGAGSAGDQGGKGKKGGGEKGKSSDPAPTLKKTEKAEDGAQPKVE